MLVLAGTTVAVRSGVFLNLDLEPVDCDDDPTCTATTRYDEDDITVTVQTTTVTGQYRAVLTAPTTLGPIDLEWEGEVDGNPVRFVDSFEVVGGELCPVNDVFTHPDMRNRQGTDRRRVADLIGDFVDLVERWCGESPIPRRTVERVDGTVLQFPNVESLTVTVDDQQITDPEVPEYGILDRTGWPYGVATVDYVHHRPSLIAPLKRACATWVAAAVAAEDAGRSRDMLWETTDAGTVRYSSPDWSAGRPTGIIAVDAALAPLASGPLVA
jgi:hypothetical protein